jgi:hypothetical protein
MRWLSTCCSYGRVSGGAVMESHPGVFRNVAVFDFKSLYPSLMRTFNLDPLAHAVAGADALVAPNGARFSRKEAILPEVLTRFGERREHAKRRGDRHADLAIKIMMNAMIGVLGAPSGRFFDPEVANAVTGFGRLMLERTRRAFEAAGARVHTDARGLEIGERLRSRHPNRHARSTGRSRIGSKDRADGRGDQRRACQQPPAPHGRRRSASGSSTSGSALRPAAEKIVIAARQRDHRAVLRNGLGHLVDGHVEVEEHGALAVVADHALDPEERREPHPARHRVDPVQAHARIEDRITRRQLDRVGAERVLDDELVARRTSDANDLRLRVE